MITIAYHSGPVGKVVRGIAAGNPNIKTYKDTDAPPQHIDTLLRWDSQVELPADRVLNSVKAVKLARDKVASRKVLAELSPKTWFTVADIPVAGKVVLRRRKHYAGHHFYVCNGRAEVATLLRKKPRTFRAGWYASQLIDKDAEYRVFILQGRALSVSRKYPGNPQQVAWNVGVGGRVAMIERAEWPIPVVQKAIEAAKRLSLDWSAVDLCTHGESIYVLEANTSPGVTTDRGRVRLAKVFAWVGQNPTPEPYIGNGRKGLLHPSLKTRE